MFIYICIYTYLYIYINIHLYVCIHYVYIYRNLLALCFCLYLCVCQFAHWRVHIWLWYIYCHLKWVQWLLIEKCQVLILSKGVTIMTNLTHTWILATNRSSVLKGAGQYLRDRVVCVQAEREASGYMGGVRYQQEIDENLIRKCTKTTQLNVWAFLQHTPEELLEYMAASDFQLVSQTDNDVIFVNNRLLGWLSEVAFCGGLGYLE